MRIFQSIVYALTKSTLPLCVIALALCSFNIQASELDSIAAVVNAAAQASFIDDIDLGTNGTYQAA